MRRLLPALLLLAGCESYTGGPVRTPVSGPVATRAVDLLPVSVAGLEAAVAEQKGKVVLIDVWFLGCKPCVKKFPQFVELHNRYADAGLACVSVDLMPSELADHAKVLAFLTVQKARFPNFILSDEQGKVDAWADRVGAIPTPAYLLYDRAGQRVPLDPNAGPDEVEAAVRRLLAG
jgi:thiol-disulfide isomerase/thioredoxin